MVSYGIHPWSLSSARLHFSYNDLISDTRSGFVGFVLGPCYDVWFLVPFLV